MPISLILTTLPRIYPICSRPISPGNKTPRILALGPPFRPCKIQCSIIATFPQQLEIEVVIKENRVSRGLEICPSIAITVEILGMAEDNVIP
jgi:hypothetical protein